MNTQINQSTPVPSTNPISAPVSHLLSTLLNATRSNGLETTNSKTSLQKMSLFYCYFLVPPTNSIVNPVPNLPINFTMPPPNHFSINQLLANVFSLGLSSSTTTPFSKYSSF